MTSETAIIEEKFNLNSGGEAKFSIHKHCRHLIMLHTEDTSAQWELDKIGVEVMGFDGVVKVGFHHKDTTENSLSA